MKKRRKMKKIIHKRKFHHSENKVSPKRNLSFSAVKIKFHCAETFLVIKKGSATCVADPSGLYY